MDSELSGSRTMQQNCLLFDIPFFVLLAVWDSSIVMAKYFERWGENWRGKRCLDLSAGCGLVGALPSACVCLCLLLYFFLSFWYPVCRRSCPARVLYLSADCAVTH